MHDNAGNGSAIEGAQRGLYPLGGNLRLSDRRAFLEQIAKPLAVSEFGCEDVRIRVLGEVAIIHGRTTYRKPDGGSGAGRYTDVWARRHGLWLCVAAHVTRG